MEIKMQHYLVFLVLIIVATGSPIKKLFRGKQQDTEKDKLEIEPPDHIEGVHMQRDGTLNREYRQEVFLGPDHDHFEKSDDGTAKKMLTKVFHDVDDDKDGSLTETELTNWIFSRTEEHYAKAIKKNKEIFPKVDKDGDGIIHWPEYRLQFLTSRGYTKEVIDRLAEADGPEDILKEHDEDDYILYRDRWARADENGDDNLDEKEFLAFLHPEHCKDTIMSLVDEILHDMDQDDDKTLSLAEFVSLPLGHEDVLEKETEEDEWVRERRKEFEQNIDLNKDGKADVDELGKYMDPRNRIHAESEARNLIIMADDDQNDKISLKEVLDNYSLFIGSKLVHFDWKVHDEF
ncbi:45 kDa calcium-binding protein-like [Anneissia japonica]|uniref:45 kDa calcium-binding protein-like n=1 Tax=Anneissia japonica TaxID=1529436 RepID=UPI00142550F3|nr:45 kDa calcium-binding protein-like [Anneissia japonica]